MSAKFKFLGQALTYDDVLLVPQYSEITPSDVNTKTRLGALELNVPIISAAMDTVTDTNMAVAMADVGGIGIIHKNMSILDQALAVTLACGTAKAAKVGAAIGVGDIQNGRLRALVQAGATLIAIDTAHGHSKNVIDAVKRAREAYPLLLIMAGNVATAEAAGALEGAGANIVKTGIGPGSICTTRVVSGAGVPQITAIIATRSGVSDAVAIVADGGIKYSGDIAKAIAAGADAVMLGNLLAGTDEAPGDLVEIDNRRFKRYRGMGSLGAMQQGSSDRYAQAGVQSDKLVPEGVEGLVPYKGSIRPILAQLVGGLRAGMGYSGAATISAMKENGKFYVITAAGQKESHPHGLASIVDAPNYRV